MEGRGETKPRLGLAFFVAAALGLWNFGDQKWRENSQSSETERGNSGRRVFMA
jgi:hypothetical protein